METGLETMRCGGCGESKHNIYTNSNDELFTECIKCKSVSKLTVSQPKIIINWTDNSEGQLCKF